MAAKLKLTMIGNAKDVGKTIMSLPPGCEVTVETIETAPVKRTITKKLKKKKDAEPKQIGYEGKPPLTQAIIAYLMEGSKSKDEIRDHCVRNGYKEQSIDSTIYQLKSKERIMKNSLNKWDVLDG